LNLGLAPIPPVPMMPETRERIKRNYDTPAMIRARENLKLKKGEMLTVRRQAAIDIMEEMIIAKTSEICMNLKWSKSKVQIVMSGLVREGLIRVTGVGSASMWELV